MYALRTKMNAMTTEWKEKVIPPVGDLHIGVRKVKTKKTKDYQINIFNWCFCFWQKKIQL